MENKKLVNKKIIDFYATWCGPCKIQKPILQKMGEKYKDELEIQYVDVDNEPELAEKYGIKAMPTLVLFVNDEQTETLVGFQKESILKEKLELK
jgi:thioredoxin 1